MININVKNYSEILKGMNEFHHLTCDRGDSNPLPQPKSGIEPIIPPTQRLIYYNKL
jgi:hypothetical protein